MNPEPPRHWLSLLDALVTRWRAQPKALRLWSCPCGFGNDHPRLCGEHRSRCPLWRHHQNQPESPNPLRRFDLLREQHVKALDALPPLSDL